MTEGYIRAVTASSGRIAGAMLKRLVGFGGKDARYLPSKVGRPVREDHFSRIQEAAAPIGSAGNMDEFADTT